MIGRFAAGLFVGCVACGAARSVPSSQETPIDFRLPDLDDRNRSAAEFRGKVVLVELWATWCEPCKVSLPAYDRWQRELGGHDFVVLAVAVDDDRAAVATFAQQRAPGLLVLHDPEAVLPARFDLRVLPSAFLIDRRGRLIRWKGGSRAADLAALRATVERLLDAN